MRLYLYRCLRNGAKLCFCTQYEELSKVLKWQRCALVACRYFKVQKHKAGKAENLKIEETWTHREMRTEMTARAGNRKRLGRNPSTLEMETLTQCGSEEQKRFCNMKGNGWEKSVKGVRQSERESDSLQKPPLSESESESTLLPSMFVLKRNLFWCYWCLTMNKKWKKQQPTKTK